MKKKIIFSILIVLALFAITGCGNSEKGTKQKTYEVTVKDLTVTYDTTESLHDITYLKASAFGSMTGKAYSTTEYRKDNISFRYSISINYYKSQTITEALMNRDFTKLANKKYNGIEYEVYSKKNIDNDTITVYAYRNNKDTYTIQFVSSYDINDLIDIFMNNISYK